MISGSKFVGVGKQLLVVALIWLTSCHQSGSASISEQQALAVAKSHVEREFTNSGAPVPPVVHDGGKVWIVEYRLLEGWTGGAPTVVIDKEDGSVLNSWSEQ
jgi:hypothetical protein